MFGVSLQVNPQRRPSAQKLAQVLGSNVSQDSSVATDVSLLKTIKVPNNRQLIGKVLPEAQYDEPRSPIAWEEKTISGPAEAGFARLRPEDRAEQSRRAPRPAAPAAPEGRRAVADVGRAQEGPRREVGGAGRAAGRDRAAGSSS